MIEFRSSTAKERNRSRPPLSWAWMDRNLFQEDSQKTSPAHLSSPPVVDRLEVIVSRCSMFASAHSQDESTASFIQAQLHSVIASQRATIESLRDSLTRDHVPRTDYDALLARLAESETHSNNLQDQLDASAAHAADLQNQLDASNTLSNQLQAELEDVHTKLTSTYAVLEEACVKIDLERAEFEKSLKHIRRTTEGEIRKTSELYAKTLAMEQTYVAQRQALDTKTNELKQLSKRMSKQEENATNRINKLAVKLEQEKFITREIVQAGTHDTLKLKTKKWIVQAVFS